MSSNEALIMTITNDPHWKNDVTALKSYEDVSTTSAMGKIAADANGGKPTALMHASDKSYDELIAEYKSGIGGVSLAETALHAADTVPEGAGLQLGVVGAAAAVALPVLALGLGTYELVEANARGHELNHALARDEQHVAMLTNLTLPQDFVQHEIATNYSHAGKSFQAPIQAMTSQACGQDHALMALVQLHCDQGMNAARDILRGASPNADVAKRYASDPAFKAGFDAMKWAHEKGGETFTNLVQDLESRDARYATAGVSFRV